MLLLKNSLALNRVINYAMHWYIFTILSKEVVTLNIQLKSLFLECVKSFCSPIGRFLNSHKIDGNFLWEFYITFL